MASVFQHLFETQPLAIALQEARQVAGVGATASIPAAELFEYVQPLPLDAAFDSSDVPAHGASLFWDVADAVVSSRHHRSLRLWRFSHDPASPNVISDVTCRVRDTGYKTHVVCDRIEVGRYDGSTLLPEVRVTDEGGRQISLPLTRDFLHSKWLCKEGLVGENAVPTFPLETWLDHGLILAFAYNLTNPAIRWVPAADDASQAAMDEMLSMGAEVADPASDRWFARAKRGDFMDLSAGGASSSTGGASRVSVAPPRILVAIAFSTYRERADFEPGGLVGMARFKPHVFVRASVPLKKVEAAVRFQRPATTTTLDRGNGQRPGTCCNALPDIGSILVADSNEDFWGPNDALKPYWSGTFSYYETEPHARLQNELMPVVRRDKPAERSVANCGYRDVPDQPGFLSLTDVLKMPRQGHWDNIHVAPRLTVDATHLHFAPLVGDPYVLGPLDRGRMRLDRVVMAPFCSHDCMHLHWRWSPASARWTKGWGPAGPYSVEGLAMLQPNHDLSLVVHGAQQFTLAEIAAPTTDPAEDASGLIPAYSAQHFFYPGAAYAQGIINWRESVFGTWLAEGAQWHGVRQNFARIAPDGSPVVLDYTTPAVLYWNVRFYRSPTFGVAALAPAASEFKAVPWVGAYASHEDDLTAAEIDRARRG